MSKQTTYDKVEILAVEVDVLGPSEAIGYICAYARRPHVPAGYVVKPYVEFLTRAAQDSELQELLNGAELAVADGVAVLWAAHYLYAGPRSSLRFWLTLGQIITNPTELKWPIPDRAAGTNFTWPLLQAAATHNLRVFLIGKPTAAEIEVVAHTIGQTVPNLAIAGAHSGRDRDSAPGQVSDAWIAHTATLIRESHADLVLIGMGFPLQERVCAGLASRLDHGVLIGEGGTFDYESFGGNRRKAPPAVQRIGLEWLWRLIQEPKRWRRQLAVPYFIYLIWRSRR